MYNKNDQITDSDNESIKQQKRKQLEVIRI